MRSRASLPCICHKHFASVLMESNLHFVFSFRFFLTHRLVTITITNGAVWSIEFLTTQTDQSKGDILIDYVLNV